MRLEKRSSLRKSLNSRARVAIFSQALNLLEGGHAQVRDISLSGAWISDLDLPSQSLPTAPFEVALIIEEGPLKGLQTSGSVVRFSSNGKLSWGLRFERLPERYQFMLQGFINKIQ
ncbi:PilZ domain-containing protein [Planctomycetota bacterium]